MARYKSSFFIKIMPIFAVEAVLVFSLLLLVFGPVTWRLENAAAFWIYILLYHLFCILGYWIGIRGALNLKAGNNRELNFFKRNYFIIFLLAMIVALGFRREYTGRLNLLPYELPREFINGLLHPGLQYSKRFAGDAFSGSPVISLLSIALSVFKYIFLSLNITLWEALRLRRRILFFIFIGFDIAIFVSIGTNRGIIYNVVYLIIALLICAARNLYLRKKRLVPMGLLVLTVGVLLFSGIYFVYSVQDRLNVPTEEYVAYVAEGNEDTSPAPAPAAANSAPVLQKEQGKLSRYIQKGLMLIDTYLCQGYYGMSLAMNESFTSTWGFGAVGPVHVRIDAYFGTRLSENTYMDKVSEHTAWKYPLNFFTLYTFFACDVSFTGVIFVMFFLGYLCALLWKDILINNSVTAQALFMLLMLLFFNMSMTNVILGANDLFMAFLVLLAFKCAQYLWRWGKKSSYYERE